MDKLYIGLVGKIFDYLLISTNNIFDIYYYFIWDNDRRIYSFKNIKILHKRKYKYIDLCIDLVDEILTLNIMIIREMKDMYYYFGWDNGRRIYNFKSVKISMKLSKFIEGMDIYYICFDGCNIINEIPEGFKCNALIIHGWNTISKIPKGLKCNILDIDGHNKISEIPKGFKCNELSIHGGNNISVIPEGFKCDILSIYGGNTINKIPEELKCNYLEIYGVNTISVIPKGLKCDQIYIGGTNTINKIPEGFKCTVLYIMNYSRLSEIPTNLSIESLMFNDDHLIIDYKKQYLNV